MAARGLVNGRGPRSGRDSVFCLKTKDVAGKGSLGGSACPEMPFPDGIDEFLDYNEVGTGMKILFACP